MAEKGITVFPDAHDHSIQGSEITAVGGSMSMGPTLKVNVFNGGTLSVSTGFANGSDSTHDTSTPKQRRRRFFQDISRFFRSPEYRDALVHQPAGPLTQRAGLTQVQQTAPEPPRQAGSTTATINAGAKGRGAQLTTLSGLDFQPIPGQEITNAEIYVRGMLRCRKGLACWDPRPRRAFARERGIVPGDVGTFDLTDGFKKIFNIWEDDGFFRKLAGQPEQLPPKDTYINQDELAGGHTVVDGSYLTVNESQDGRHFTSFEFNCHSKEGAILVCTAPADLEELDHSVALRQFLVTHAGVVYQHANSIRQIADEDSLYIVTGCIKSDSWALAAWQDSMQAPHNLMKLVPKRSSNHEDQVPSYIWTHRGTAETQSGATSVGANAERLQRKDQCLFLRGFKLSLSKDFRSRLKDPSFNHISKSKGDGGDLEEAISLHRETLKLWPTSSPCRSLSLHSLGSALLDRYRRTGIMADLAEAISLYREVLQLWPSKHPDRWLSLNNLGDALLGRYRRTETMADLEDAVPLYREALELRPPPHPDRCSPLKNLGYALLHRYRHTGTMADLKEAISLNREVLKLQPSPHPYRALSLNHLGNALVDHYRRTDTLSDLEEAMSLYREVLELQPSPHPDRSSSLTNLGNALLDYDRHSGTMANLEESITLHREALKLRPSPHPHRALSLRRLSISLHDLYEVTRTLSPLQEAILYCEELLTSHYPLGHRHRLELLNRLVSLLQKRCQTTGQPEDFARIASLEAETRPLSASTSTT